MAKDDYAIVFGINKYRHLRTLRGARNDAQQIYEWLKDDKGGAVPKDHILPIETFPDGDKPGETDFRELLVQLLRPVVEGQDNEGYLGRRLYIFVAGHGVARAINSVHLLLVDHHPDLHSHIAPLTLADTFAEAGLFQEIVVLMDCCRELQVDLSNPASWLPQRKAQPRAAKVRRCYLLASGPYGFAREIDWGGGQFGGVFTHALLRILRGEVASSPGGITNKTLFNHLKDLVRQLRPANDIQEPELPKIDDDIVFVMTPAVAMTTLSIQVPPQSIRIRVHCGDPSFAEVDTRELDTTVATTLTIAVPRGRLYVVNLWRRENTPPLSLLVEAQGENVNVSFL